MKLETTTKHNVTKGHAVNTIELFATLTAILTCRSVAITTSGRPTTIPVTRTTVTSPRR